MRTTRQRRRKVEALEARAMMAGNVTAQLVDGDLIVTGDGANNAIRFEHSGGTHLLVGENDDAGNPTSINGVPNGSFDYTALTGSAVARMHDGNDRVSLNFTASFPGALVIETGAGDDRING